MNCAHCGVGLVDVRTLDALGTDSGPGRVCPRCGRLAAQHADAQPVAPSHGLSGGVVDAVSAGIGFEAGPMLAAARTIGVRAERELCEECGGLLVPCARCVGSGVVTTGLTLTVTFAVGGATRDALAAFLKVKP